MKQSFPALPTRQVKLQREQADGSTAEIVLELRPWPIGYSEYLSRVFPPPVHFVDLKPVEKPEAQREYQAQLGLVLLARSLGDQLDARSPPERADRAAWEAYAAAIRDELAAANLVDGDVGKLLAEASRVNRGAGKLGKGE